MTVPFPRPVKRAALLRSGNLCEAVGNLYGLAEDHRCNAPLAYGVEFDHIVLHANSKDSSLENCAAVCVRCHKFKTARHDTPLAAKTLRQQDKASGVSKPRGFYKPKNARWDWQTGRWVFGKTNRTKASAQAQGAGANTLSRRNV